MKVLLIIQDPKFGGGVEAIAKILIQVLEEIEEIDFSTCFIKVPSLHGKPKSFHIKDSLVESKVFGKAMIEINRSSLLSNQLLRYSPLQSLDDWLDQFDLFFFSVASLNELLPFKFTKKQKVGWIATDVKGDFDFRIESQSSKLKKIYMHAYKNLLHGLQYSSGNDYEKVFPLSDATEKAIAPFCKGKLLKPLLFPASVRKTKVEYPEKEFHFISLGRVCDPRKDFKSLITAFAGAHRDNPKIRLTIMGKCSDPELAELPNKLGCEKAIRLTGFVSQEEKEKLLSSSHCFILTSRQEGLGIVYLEGQEYGLPCIATDNGGATSIVHHEINGLISPVGDISSLKENILKISSDQEFYQKLQLAVTPLLKKSNSMEEFKNRIERAILG